jgi:hypothetical protein
MMLPPFVYEKKVWKKVLLPFIVPYHTFLHISIIQAPPLQILNQMINRRDRHGGEPRRRNGQGPALGTLLPGKFEAASDKV